MSPAKGVGAHTIRISAAGGALFLCSTIMGFDQPRNRDLPIVTAHHVADLTGDGPSGTGVLYDKQLISIFVKIILSVAWPFFTADVLGIIVGITNHHPIQRIPGCI